MPGFTIPMTVAQQIWAQLPGAKGAAQLLPGDLLRLWEQTPSAQILQESVPGWSAFESGELDFETSDFATWMGISELDASEMLILVTDEGWRDQVAFRFPAGDFEAFATWYESHYQMAFFQSADYILFPENLAFANILHHEGVIFYATRDVSASI